MPTELGAVGLIEGSSRPNAAMLFYDWWMGDEGQALLVDGRQVLQPHRPRAAEGQPAA